MVICGAIAVALTMFFKVETVSVEGNSRYTSDQIIEASGIKTGRVAAVLTGKAQRGSSRIGKTEVIYLVTVK